MFDYIPAFLNSLFLTKMALENSHCYMINWLYTYNEVREINLIPMLVYHLNINFTLIVISSTSPLVLSLASSHC